MPSPLAPIYSKADSFKRSLLDILTNPVASAQQIVGNANDRAGLLNQLTSDAAQESMAGDMMGPKSQQLAGQIADAYNPMGMVLLHGGRFPVDKVDPNMLRTAVHSGGFHTTNKVFTPQTFATNANDGKGVISAFEFPDELYKQSIKVNNKPIDQNMQGVVSKLIQRDPSLQPVLVNEMKSAYKAAIQEGRDIKPEDALNAIQLNMILRRHYGGINQSEQALSDAGVPAKSWVYSRERPSEVATAIFPQYVDELRPLGQFPTEKGLLFETTQQIKEALAKQNMQVGK